MHIPGAEIRVVQAVRQFLGKFSEGKQAHERQLRDSMMVDARDFSTGVRQAIMGVKNAVTLPARQLSDVSVVWKALPEVERLVNEANARLHESLDRVTGPCVALRRINAAWDVRPIPQPFPHA